MPTMPRRLRPAGSRSPGQARREQDERRGSASERGYTGRWAKASASFRRRCPLCEYCALDGRVEPATLTDHLYPHRVFADVFWRSEWWVASCTPCHSGMKQAVERAGKAAIDALARRLGRPVMGREGGAAPGGG
ncbi:hypothetical protein EBF16_16395 [Sphingobium yanoikuyae]|uniref:HNH endonuclease n=2 Tax=Sphingobium yanoikuyae TaxID=13690 RepID=A0A3G2UVR6_SPHYA|nr:hypothetical protein EBF16_16395 [Sphingobium yanoikuyae]